MSTHTEARAEQRAAAIEILLSIGDAVAGARLEPFDYGVALGFRVRETSTHYLDVVEQLYNWRVVAIPCDDLTYVEAAYCYLGKGVDSFTRAVLGAAVWDGPGHGDPPGWDKNALTGRWADGREKKR